MNRSNKQFLVVLVIAAIAVIVMWPAGDDDGPSSGAQAACREFTSLATDWETLSDAQRLERAQSIDEYARAADEAGVADAARTMVAAINNNALTPDHVHAVGESCQDVGALD